MFKRTFLLLVADDWSQLTNSVDAFKLISSNKQQATRNPKLPKIQI